MSNKPIDPKELIAAIKLIPGMSDIFMKGANSANSQYHIHANGVTVATVATMGQQTVFDVNEPTDSDAFFKALTKAGLDKKSTWEAIYDQMGLAFGGNPTIAQSLTASRNLLNTRNDPIVHKDQNGKILFEVYPDMLGTYLHYLETQQAQAASVAGQAANPVAPSATSAPQNASILPPISEALKELQPAVQMLSQVTAPSWAMKVAQGAATAFTVTQVAFNVADILSKYFPNTPTAANANAGGSQTQAAPAAQTSANSWRSPWEAMVSDPGTPQFVRDPLNAALKIALMEPNALKAQQGFETQIRQYFNIPQGANLFQAIQGLQQGRGTGHGAGQGQGPAYNKPQTLAQDTHAQAALLGHLNDAVRPTLQAANGRQAQQALVALRQIEKMVMRGTTVEQALRQHPDLQAGVAYAARVGLTLAEGGALSPDQYNAVISIIDPAHGILGPGRGITPTGQHGMDGSTRKQLGREEKVAAGFNNFTPTAYGVMQRVHDDMAPDLEGLKVRYRPWMGQVHMVVESNSPQTKAMSQDMLRLHVLEILKNQGFGFGDKACKIEAERDGKIHVTMPYNREVMKVHDEHHPKAERHGLPGLFGGLLDMAGGAVNLTRNVAAGTITAATIPLTLPLGLVSVVTDIATGRAGTDHASWLSFTGLPNTLRAIDNATGGARGRETEERYLTAQDLQAVGQQALMILRTTDATDPLHSKAERLLGICQKYAHDLGADDRTHKLKFEDFDKEVRRDCGHVSLSWSGALFNQASGRL